MQYVLLKTTYPCMNVNNFLPKFVKQLLTTGEADVSRTTNNPDISYHSLHKEDTK